MELVVVYTGEAWEAIILRYLLNKDGIKTWLTNKRAEAIGQTSNLPSAWESVTIKVTVLDYEKARLIVAKFEEKAQDDKFKFDL